MLCDICHKREARIYYTEIINGEKKEQHLCEECAAEHTSFSAGKLGGKGELTLGNLLSSLLQGFYNGETKKVENEDLVCPKCGTSFEEFSKTGLLGCADCYKSFGSAIKESLNKIHGSELHTGKRPKGYEQEKAKEAEKRIQELSEIERLSIQLQQAIEQEEFEEAARLRDRIRELKAEEDQDKEGAPNA
ncbi:MAG: UvrB/UvrC motif-containing protein [Lachnospiraceae bacterium]|nr:UvrB/UvrC motif-containing protein [Lachnospiraceae bacterium]